MNAAPNIAHAAELTLTLARDEFDNSTERVETWTWAQFVEYATTHDRRPDKRKGRAGQFLGFSLTQFATGPCNCGVAPSEGPNGQRKKGCPDFGRTSGKHRGHRTVRNVIAVTALGLDLDKNADGSDLSEAGATEARERLKSSGYSHIVHSSHSYAPPTKNSLRAIVQLSRPVTVDEWHRGFYGAAIRHLQVPSGIGDKPDPRRFWYGPSAPLGAAVVAEAFDGVALDVDAILATITPVEKPKPKRKTSRIEGGLTWSAAIAKWCPDAWVFTHGSERRAIVECPNADNHSDDNREAMVFDTVPWGFHCMHAHCEHLQWRDFRKHHEPDWVPFDERPPSTNRTPPSTAGDDMEHERSAGFDSSRSSDAESDFFDDEVPPPSDADQPPRVGRKSKPSIATALVDLATQRSDLWHSPDGDVYATITVDDHKEHVRVGSTDHKRWLARLGWRELAIACGDTPIKSACTTLAGIAIHDGTRHPVHLRVAEAEGSIWLDLCDVRWRAVAVDTKGWRVVNEPSVRFVRRSAMSALPVPIAGGNIDELRDHVRITDDSWPLVVGWLVGALAPRGPYPALVFRGQHGAGKSWGARTLRSLVDPSIAPIRSEPREPRDLVIGAKGSHVIALDNLSSLPPWLSDGLCRLATGGGYAARSLYTDQDETVIDVQRPAILTGITDVVTAPDLLDRSLLVELEAIAPEDRETERALLARWMDGAQPRILGALLTAVSVALRRRDAITFARLPRLADWAQFATAAEPSLGLADGAIITALEDQAEEATEIALDASIIAAPIRALVASQRPLRVWEGTAAELLIALSNRVEQTVMRDKSWPRTARGMAGALARIARPLQDVGVSVARLPRSNGARGWKLQGSDGQ